MRPLEGLARLMCRRTTTFTNADAEKEPISQGVHSLRLIRTNTASLHAAPLRHGVRKQLPLCGLANNEECGEQPPSPRKSKTYLVVDNQPSHKKPYWTCTWVPSTTPICLPGPLVPPSLSDSPCELEAGGQGQPNHYWVVARAHVAHNDCACHVYTAS